VGLREDLDRIAGIARQSAEPGEELAAVIPAEPADGLRVYLCAFERGDRKAWLALDGDARPLHDRALVRDAVSIAAMCEIAEETAGGGSLEALRAQLRTLRLTENPEGIEEAETAALELERTLGTPPRLATPAFLDEVGLAARRLEQSLGDLARSPFGEAMKQAVGPVGELKLEVESSYKGPLD
jgi:hypothetical protein